MRKKAVRITVFALCAFFMIAFSSSAFAAVPPENKNKAVGEPGYIHLNKTAVPTDIKDVYKIEMSIDPWNQAPTAYVDIVLVLDTSESMGWCLDGSQTVTRIDVLKQSVKEFAKIAIGEDATSSTTRIGVVSFGDRIDHGVSGAKQYGVSNSYSQIVNWANALTPSYYTPAVLGLLEANKMLASSFPRPAGFRDGIDKISKYVIVMTDGGFTRVDAGVQEDPDSEKAAQVAADEIKMGVTAGNYVSLSKVGGTGTSGVYTERPAAYSPPAPNGMTLPGTDPSKHVARIYGIGMSDASATVGLQKITSDEGPNGKNAKSDYYYPGIKPTELVDVFKDLAQKISAPAVTVGDVYIFDRIGSQFSLYQYPGKQLFEVSAPSDVGVNRAYNSGIDITWMMDKLSENGPATLIYYLKMDVETADPELWYPTNEYAYIEYQSGYYDYIQDEYSIKYFPEPLINAKHGGGKTPTPTPTKTPKPTYTYRPTPTPATTITPGRTHPGRIPTYTPSRTPRPARTPKPEKTPKPTRTPKPARTPSVTLIPDEETGEMTLEALAEAARKRERDRVPVPVTAAGGAIGAVGICASLAGLAVYIKRKKK